MGQGKKKSNKGIQVRVPPEEFRKLKALAAEYSNAVGVDFGYGAYNAKLIREAYEFSSPKLSTTVGDNFSLGGK